MEGRQSIEQAEPTPERPRPDAHLSERVARIEVIVDHQDRRLGAMEDAFKRHQDSMDQYFGGLHERINALDKKQDAMGRKLLFWSGLIIGGAAVVGFLWAILIQGSMAANNMGFLGG